MVIVDSCVWIDLLRDRETRETILAQELAAVEQLGLGDLILFEVLQGVVPESAVPAVRQRMGAFPVFPMGGKHMALRSAEHSRALRARGVQASTVDCFIATFCIVDNYALLTSDRHFEPFARHLGLVLA